MAPNTEAKGRYDDDDDDAGLPAEQTEQEMLEKLEQNYMTEAERIEAELKSATWGEVYEACCVHSASGWAWIFFGLVTVFFFLYWFMYALEILGTSAKVLTGCTAASLFGESTNPVAAVMIGAIVTVLLDSSSTTTSITISLTGTVLTLDQAIYIVMGCNIGTTLTSTVVATSHMGNGDLLERAFAGSTIHDMYNYMSVILFLPIEIAFGFLAWLSGLMTKGVTTSEGDEWEGPAKKYVDPLGERLIKSNSKLVKAVALGEGTCEVGGGFYPIICEPGEPTYDTCSQVGLISCSSDTNRCPAMFSPTATLQDDKVSGGVMLFLAVCLLFLCLGCLVMVLSKMLGALTHRTIYKVVSLNGYLLMVFGCGLTMLIQSSSVMCSTLVPLVAVGAIQLEQMYALVLGANVGTCITGIMAALVTEGTLPLRVALCHLLFNVLGIFAFYVVPITRLPLVCGRWLGRMTRHWRGFPILYILTLFCIVPLTALGISSLYAQGTPGFTILGVFFTAIITIVIIGIVVNLRFRGGWERWMDYFARREVKRSMYENLGSDLTYLKEKVALILDHTGLEKNQAESETKEFETKELEAKDGTDDSNDNEIDA